MRARATMGHWRSSDGDNNWVAAELLGGDDRTLAEISAGRIAAPVGWRALL